MPANLGTTLWTMTRCSSASVWLLSLSTGRRTATYKLATLMASIEHCIENLPEQPDDTLRVPLPALADRALEHQRATGSSIQRQRTALVNRVARAQNSSATKGARRGL